MIRFTFQLKNINYSNISFLGLLPRESLLNAPYLTYFITKQFATYIFAYTGNEGYNDTCYITGSFDTKRYNHPTC